MKDANKKSTSISAKPLHKKKTIIIAISSILGTSAIATAIAVPIVLTNKSSSGTTNPNDHIDPNILKKINDFNNQKLSDKIIAYNTLMTANNSAINKHFLNDGGANNWTIANTMPSKENPISVKQFFDYIKNWNVTPPSISYGTDAIIEQLFLTLPTFSLPDPTTNINPELAYINTSPNINDVNSMNSVMYALPISIIKDISISYSKDLYSIRIMPLQTTLDGNSVNWTMWQLSPTSVPSFSLFYKEAITIDNDTIFPNVSQYIKTSILKIF